MADDQLAALAQEPAAGHGTWSHEALRVASLEDAVRQQTWVLMRLMGDPKAKIPPPEPVRRPGVGLKQQQRRRALSDEGRAYLEYLRANRGALPPGYTMVQAT